MARHTAGSTRSTTETSRIEGRPSGAAADRDTDRPIWRSDPEDGRGSGAVAAEDLEDEVDGTDRARARFGGTNWGSAFFGWLVAIALTVLLTGIVGAIAAAIGTGTDLTQTDAQRHAGPIGLAAAIAAVVILAIGYYAGGYVSGRMSRFHGGRQGFGVWLIGLVVTLVAVGVGAAFGAQYNVLDRVDLPRLPVPNDTATWGGVITGVVILLVTLVAALVGGKAGHRYHDRVDRVVRGDY